MSGSFEAESAGHPIWCGAITGFVGAALMEMYRPNRVIDDLGNLITRLMQSGQLGSYADLELHARREHIPLFLAAAPFNPAEHPPDIRCIDARTYEPKPYLLNMVIGAPPDDKNASRAVALNAVAAVNIPRLRTETGSLARVLPRLGSGRIDKT